MVGVGVPPLKLQWLLSHSKRSCDPFYPQHNGHSPFPPHALCSGQTPLLPHPVWFSWGFLCRAEKNKQKKRLYESSRGALGVRGRTGRGDRDRVGSQTRSPQTPHPTSLPPSPPLPCEGVLLQPHCLYRARLSPSMNLMLVPPRDWLRSLSVQGSQWVEEKVGGSCFRLFFSFFSQSDSCAEREREREWDRERERQGGKEKERLGERESETDQTQQPPSQRATPQRQTQIRTRPLSARRSTHTDPETDNPKQAVPETGSGQGWIPPGQYSMRSLLSKVALS